jgi:GrpB-like predicted nucleotidyltransferase (UPF0157 family)
MLKFPVSDPVVVFDYDPQWPQTFHQMKQELEEQFGFWAERIDHIGSTSVPGLAAKNIIDIQITVKDLEHPEFKAFLKRFDESSPHYSLRPYDRDELTGMDDNHPGLKKRFMKLTRSEVTANIHIRQAGNINQRYALLFAAFLRANPAQREIYSLLKQRLATLFPESIEGYLYIKDPLMDLLYLQAETWALDSNWSLANA